MAGRIARYRRASLGAFIVVGLLPGAPGHAQAPGPAAPTAASADPGAPPPPGPDSPMEAMPDLGVAWPDLDAPATAAPGDVGGRATASPVTPGATPAAPARLVETQAGVRGVRLVVDGLAATEGAERVMQAFDRQSLLVKAADQATNAAQVDRRARADADLLGELLRAEGFYDNTVDVLIGATDGGGALEVRLVAAPGARYRFETVDLPGLDAAGAAAPALRDAFAVRAGDPVVAADVLAAEVALRTRLAESGFASATVGAQDIVIDHDRGVAILTLPVTPGPLARFGAIRVSGSPPFPASHVAAIARFHPGDLYQQSEVDDLRRALVATGLVASVETRLVPSADGQRVDLAVSLTPAPMRTVAGELGYGTGEGVRAAASWQHRNFFNPEGALLVRGVVGTQEQSAGVSLRRSNFGRRDRVANLSFAAAHLDREAYEARTLELAANLERQSSFIWQKPWTWSLGGQLITSDERDTDPATGGPRRRTFFIGALPVGVAFDGSDSLLDPTRGFRLAAHLSPEASLQSGASGYVKAQLDGSGYWPVATRVVAAGRLRFGWIAGAARDEIAPSRRFYAGGGGSVRGYGYQRLGPRDAANTPIGGRSLAEFALEARVRLGDFGIVPFVDGGVLSPEARPDLADLQLGAGIGLRYHSPFGPIRIDVGTPLNRQKGDSRLAVVVSLGQAF